MCQTYIPEPRSTETRMERLGREIHKAAGYINRKTFAKLRVRKQPRLRFVKEQTGNTVVLLMAVREDNKAYLADALRSVQAAVDFAILADATADGQAEAICADILGNDRCKVVAVKEQDNCYGLLWPMAEDCGAKWILAMDADEVLQTGGTEAARHLVNNVFIDAYNFCRYDMCSADEYRADKTEKRPYLMRYQKDYPFTWGASDKLPAEVSKLVHANMNLKVCSYRNVGTNLFVDPSVLKAFSDLQDEI